MLPMRAKNSQLARRADEREIKNSASETKGSLFAGCASGLVEPAITSLLANKIISFFANFRYFLNF